MRRAAAYGQGWYGFGLDIDETATVIERLKAAGGEHLEINITPRIGLTDETVTAFSKLGVHRLILVAPQLQEDPMFGRIEAMAPFAR
jgi:hypothetical protein